MTKPTKWSVLPAKIQISLGIRAVWSESAFHMKKHWVLSYPLSTKRRLWSDWADAQADLSLRWAHRPFCWFCHEAAHMCSFFVTLEEYLWPYHFRGRHDATSLERLFCPLKSNNYRNKPGFPYYRWAMSQTPVIIHLPAVVIMLCRIITASLIKPIFFLFGLRDKSVSWIIKKNI